MGFLPLGRYQEHPDAKGNGRAVSGEGAESKNRSFRRMG